MGGLNCHRAQKTLHHHHVVHLAEELRSREVMPNGFTSFGFL